MKTNTEVDDGCILTPLVLLVSPLVWALWAWVLTLLWGWYATPLLGEPDTGLTLSALLVFFALHLLRSKSRDREEGSWAWFGRWFAKFVLAPLLLLYVGWGAGKVLGVL